MTIIILNKGIVDNRVDSWGLRSEIQATISLHTVPPYSCTQCIIQNKNLIVQ